MNSRHKPYGPYEKYFKHPLDVFCGILALVFFGWLYLIIAIIVRIKMGSPVIFVQNRPGMNEKIFKLYKFRTMSDERDAEGNLLPDEMRLNRFGKFLRASSLDELPEAINLINGTLSVCGPRPLLERYLDRYNEEQHRRHEIRPGLSGYAQVNGRNAITWEEKFKLDLEYVDKITFIGDLKIVLKTIRKALFSRDGITSDSSATMEEFLGNK